MQKKTLRRVLSLTLATGLLATQAFAAWNGQDSHNAVVSSAPTSSTISEKSLKLVSSGSGWDGVDNVPVMQTVNGNTYAYVLFDGYSANGAQVAKIDCAAGTDVWKTTATGTAGSTSLQAKNGFQLSTPYLDKNNTPNDESDDTLYVGVISKYDEYVSGSDYLTGTGSKIMKLTGLDSTQPTVSTVLTSIDGQINTPITKYGDYIYFGTWPGGTKAGTYYQVNVTDNTVKKFTPSSYGFYWAGAATDGKRVYFGSDNGTLYWRSIASFDTKGGSLDLATATNGASDVGNIRSTVMFDNDNLYFTSQGGYLWCCQYSDSSLSVRWKAKLDGTSTSTPTKVGNRIYVGFYSGFTKGGVQCVVMDEDEDGNLVPSVQTVVSVAQMPVQCSIVVKGTGSGTDYVYFNTNAAKGCGYCYSYDGSSSSKVWSTTEDTYALGGMACDNGYIVFGNDYNNLYIVK